MVRRPSTLLPFAALAACQADRVALAPVVMPSRAVATAAEFPGADRVLRGVEVPTGDAEWRVGDEVLFGLRLRRGDTAQHWMLHVRVEEMPAIARAGDGGEPGTALAPAVSDVRVNGAPRSFSSRRCRVAATVLDRDANVLGRTSPVLPCDTIARGYGPACEHVERAAKALVAMPNVLALYDRLELDQLADAVVSTMALVAVAENDRVLAPLLWTVVQRPSAWSIVKHLGADVVVQPHFHRVRRDTQRADLAGEPRWIVPIDVLVNEEPALGAHLHVVPSLPPLALCGGIVAGVAQHPVDERVTFAFVLLAARRGPVQLGRTVDGR